MADDVRTTLQRALAQLNSEKVPSELGDYSALWSKPYRSATLLPRLLRVVRPASTS